MGRKRKRKKSGKIVGLDQFAASDVKPDTSNPVFTPTALPHHSFSPLEVAGELKTLFSQGLVKPSEIAEGAGNPIGEQISVRCGEVIVSVQLRVVSDSKVEISLSWRPG